MKRIDRPRAPVLLVLMLAAALIAVAWGHRLPQGDAESAALLQIYQLAGGDPDGLCGTGTPDAAAYCDACRLSDAPGLPDPPFGIGQAPTNGVLTKRPPTAMVEPERACHPAWQGRAPPVV